MKVLAVVAMLSLAAAPIDSTVPSKGPTIEEMLEQRNALQRRLLSISKYRNDISVRHRELIHCGLGTNKDIESAPDLPKSIYYGLTSSEAVEEALVAHILMLEKHNQKLVNLILNQDQAVLSCLSKKLR